LENVARSAGALHAVQDERITPVFIPFRQQSEGLRVVVFYLHFIFSSLCIVAVFINITQSARIFLYIKKPPSLNGGQRCSAQVYLAGFTALPALIHFEQI
jgi:hypothetical protein